MKNKMIFLWFICGIWQVSIAKAQPVDLVIVKHNQATTQQQLQITQLGFSKLLQAGKNHTVSKLTITSDILLLNKLEQYTSRGDNWYNLAIRNKWCRKSVQCHLSLPPVFDANGVDYGGGVAQGQCKPRGYSYSIIRAKNLKGLPRLTSSVTNAAHEVAHLDGAGHDDSGANIMDSAAGGRYGEANLNFNKKAIDQIKRCRK